MNVPVLWTWMLLLLSWASVAAAQINVLIVTEEEHSPAMEHGLQSALSYLEKEKLADINLNNISLIENQTLASTKSLELVCSELDSMISAGSPPDLVLDFTLSGRTSEAMKKISLNLGLPTVTSALGEQKEVWSWADLSQAQQGYLVQVRGPADILPNIVTDLANMTDMNTAAVLYDNTFNLKKHFKNLFVNLPVRHRFIDLEDPMYLNNMDMNNMNMNCTNMNYTNMNYTNMNYTNMNYTNMNYTNMNCTNMNSTNATSTFPDTLNHLIKTEKIKNFFILAEPSRALDVMTEVDGMMRYGSRLAWFVGSLSSVDTASCCGDMRLFQYHPRQSAFQSIIEKFELTEEPLIESAFYADLTFRSILTVDQMKKDGTWPAMEYSKCIDFTGQPVIRDLNIKSALASSNFPGQPADTVTWSTNGESRFQFDVDVQKQEPGDNMATIGTWSARPLRPDEQPSLELAAGQEDSLVLKSKREVLQVVTGVQHPFMYYNETDHGYSGFAFDMLNMLSEELGFDYELNIASDNGTYGRNPDEGDNWEGLMGDLVNDRADIGLASLHVTAVRQIDVDFTVPFYEFQGWTVMMKREPANRNPFYFFWIMQWPIWKMLTACYFLGIFILYFSINLSQYSYRNNMEQYVSDPEIRYFGVRELNYFCFMCFTGQGGGLFPKGPTNGFFLAAWWTFAFISVSSYAANTGANLTINRMITRNEDYESIIKQFNLFDYGMLNDSEPWHYYKSMVQVEGELYRQYKKLSILDNTLTEKQRSMYAVWNFPVNNFYTAKFPKYEEGKYILPDDYSDAVYRMAKGTRKERDYFAFFSDETDARNLENTWCTVERVGQDQISAKPYALAVQKGRPKLLAALNAGIMKLQNQKKLESLKEKWWHQNPHKPFCEEYTDLGRYDIWNIGGLFVLMPIGVCICVFYLYLEFVFYKFREWYDRSQLRAKWKSSYFRSLLPHLITGQTVLTKENATEEQLEIMRKTEEEWMQKKYN